jgi:RNA polymerase sigma factor (TIGR02999 family)
MGFRPEALPMIADPSDVTKILLSLQTGDVSECSAARKLFELAYDELHGIAAALMRKERADHTLQPTALVNEAYCRLIDQTRVGWENRAHFFGIAARAMRQILVDHARKKAAAKRGGDWQQITFDERMGVAQRPEIEIVELDEALQRLSEMDERMARVAELRVFGGLSSQETAHVLGVSKRTVQNDWRVARMWLSHELAGVSEE